MYQAVHGSPVRLAAHRRTCYCADCQAVNLHCLCLYGKICASILGFKYCRVAAAIGLSGHFGLRHGHSLSRRPGFPVHVASEIGLVGHYSLQHGRFGSPYQRILNGACREQLLTRFRPFSRSAPYRGYTSLHVFGHFCVICRVGGPSVLHQAHVSLALVFVFRPSCSIFAVEANGNI